LTNQHQFETLRLWEHADRIRGGDFRELAPLLLLCDDTPREATLRQERELILSLQAPQPIQADLLAVAVMVGIRFFARDLVEAVFAEEMQMLKESSFIEEWIEEAVARATTDAEAQSARRFLLRQLRHRFGALPDEVVEQIGTAGREWCEAMGERLLDATSLEELGFGGNGAHPS
jgi:predicted transposase YdaD